MAQEKKRAVTEESPTRQSPPKAGDGVRRGEKKPEKPKFTRGPVVDNIEMVVVAVLLALIIRCFLIEAFEIPTGSMAPTLYGAHSVAVCPNCSYRYVVGDSGSDPVRCPNCGSTTPARSLSRVWGGDRILVNKVLYRFDRPQRWDPFVFINPDLGPKERSLKTTYIKRLIGLPTDKLEIIRGDIVVHGLIQRKPYSAQSVLWMLVYDSRWPWQEKKKETWRSDGAAKWVQDKANGRLTVDTGGKSVTTFANFAGHDGNKLIKDDYGYDRGPGRNVVTDVRVRTTVTVEGAGELELVLPEDGSALRWVVGAKGSGVEGAVLSDGKLLGKVDYALAPGKSAKLELSRVDYLVTARADGREVFRLDLWSSEVYDRLSRDGRLGLLEGHFQSGVRLGVRGLKAAFDEIRIDRDIYYTAETRIWSYKGNRFGEGATLRDNYLGPIQLSPDQYLAMGDNSPESLDSRYWGPVPAENLVGKALVVWWPPMRPRLIR